MLSMDLPQQYDINQAEVLQQCTSELQLASLPYSNDYGVPSQSNLSPLPRLCLCPNGSHQLEEFNVNDSDYGPCLPDVNTLQLDPIPYAELTQIEGSNFSGYHSSDQNKIDEVSSATKHAPDYEPPTRYYCEDSQIFSEYADDASLYRDPNLVMEAMVDESSEQVLWTQNSGTFEQYDTSAMTNKCQRQDLIDHCVKTIQMSFYPHLKEEDALMQLTSDVQMIMHLYLETTLEGVRQRVVEDVHLARSWRELLQLHSQFQ